MSNDERKALDLDDLFGQARAVKVKWQGKEYELIQLSGIGPKDALLLQKMQARITALGSQEGEFSDQNAEELEKMFDEMLSVLSKELPLETIPFGGKMRIIEFYTEETSGKKKKAMSQKLTGEKSSPD